MSSFHRGETKKKILDIGQLKYTYVFTTCLCILFWVKEKKIDGNVGADGRKREGSNEDKVDSKARAISDKNLRGDSKRS